MKAGCLSIWADASSEAFIPTATRGSPRFSGGGARSGDGKGGLGSAAAVMTSVLERFSVCTSEQTSRKKRGCFVASGSNTYGC